MDGFLNWNPFGDAEPFEGETLVADGWVYKDFYPMLEEYWAFTLGLFGEGNYRLVTYAERYFDGDDRLYKRGQMFVSPQGMANVINHVAARKAAGLPSYP